MPYSADSVLLHRITVPLRHSVASIVFMRLNEPVLDGLVEFLQPYDLGRTTLDLNGLSSSASSSLGTADRIMNDAILDALLCLPEDDLRRFQIYAIFGAESMSYVMAALMVHENREPLFGLVGRILSA